MKQVRDNVKVEVKKISWEAVTYMESFNEIQMSVTWESIWHVIDNQVIGDVANPLSNHVRIDIWKETHVM